jgi:hypothetical protein
MTRIFGNSWTSRYGDTDDGMWESVIAGLGRDEVRHGLRHMLTAWTDSFPPTPAQFLAVARIPLAHRPAPIHRQLAAKASDPKRARAEIDALRRMLD